MIKIDKNVPIPNIEGITGAKSIYPWRLMEIGDSFFIEKPPKYAGHMAYDAGRRTGRKFANRKAGNGTRIWRIA